MWTVYAGTLNAENEYRKNSIYIKHINITTSSFQTFIAIDANKLNGKLHQVIYVPDTPVMSNKFDLYVYCVPEVLSGHFDPSAIVAIERLFLNLNVASTTTNVYGCISSYFENTIYDGYIGVKVVLGGVSKKGNFYFYYKETT